MEGEGFLLKLKKVSLKTWLTIMPNQEKSMEEAGYNLVKKRSLYYYHNIYQTALK
jgi:hypothetical protein